MEGDTVGIETHVARLAQQIDRHLGRAAEFTRQRPIGAGAFNQDAAEDACPRSRAGELFHLGLAVEGEEAHALLIGIGDVALFLDRVAVGDVLGGDAALQAEVDLVAAGDVEARAQILECRNHLGRRVRLDRVEHTSQRQIAPQQLIRLRHDIEIDDQAGRFGLSLGEKLSDLLIDDLHCYFLSRDAGPAKLPGQDA